MLGGYPETAVQWRSEAGVLPHMRKAGEGCRDLCFVLFDLYGDFEQFQDDRAGLCGRELDVLAPECATADATHRLQRAIANA
jgi:hypothetical protein